MRHVLCLLFLFVAAFKWLLLGRYKPRAVPMWTPFVWLSEAATNIYEGIAVPNFMNYLRGTLAETKTSEKTVDPAAAPEKKAVPN